MKKITDKANEIRQKDVSMMEENQRRREKERTDRILYQIMADLNGVSLKEVRNIDVSISDLTASHNELVKILKNLISAVSLLAK